MWHRRVIRRTFVTCCNCVQITLAAADVHKPFATLGSRAGHRVPSLLAAYSPRRSASVGWPWATTPSIALLEEQKGQFPTNRQMVTHPLGSCKSSHIGADTAEKRQASPPEPSKICPLSRECCAMPAGISCNALSLLQVYIMGKKVESINWSPEHLNWWRDGLWALWIHCKEVKNSRWQQSGKSSGLWPRSPGC